MKKNVILYLVLTLLGLFLIVNTVTFGILSSFHKDNLNYRLISGLSMIFFYFDLLFLSKIVSNKLNNEIINFFFKDRSKKQ